ncbi:MAG TPA: GNAT family N-acetyltransferase [Phycisphaerae bacterium]|nr:GNAT family N-acetyltransferase [Phycisphaerae bacterium]HNU46465.1 GNAT family N-acetyltransferase [Phycisphaerae bacterium]
MQLKGFPKDVSLKHGRTVRLRGLQPDDFDRLYAFFSRLPDEDRLFVRHDVLDPKTVRGWVENVDYTRVVPLVAEEEGRIVGDATLHTRDFGWTRHVGRLRVIIADTHRRTGLGSLMAHELVTIGEERGLEKIEADIFEDDLAAMRLLERLGFQHAAVLKELVKDHRGAPRNLAVMISDVGELGRVLEDWIHDSIQPGYRSPGPGH